MSLIDSHAHLTCPEVLPHLDKILTRAKVAAISHILNICTDPGSLREGLQLCQNHPNILNAGATTPHDVLTEGESAFSHFEIAAREGKLSAIGETGLDYHYEHSPKDLQIHFLTRYLNLATATRLPIIFHCRDAFSDLFALTSNYTGPAILHCFTGTLSDAETALKRGWHISFSGIVTFKKSAPLRSVAQTVPLSQLLIETDTPYLAPQTHRGLPNEPAFLPETAECLANLKGIPLAELAQATSQNAKNLFGFL